MSRRLAPALLALALAATAVACGDKGGRGHGIHVIGGTVTVTIAAPASWLAALSAADRTALRQGRPQHPCPPPPGTLSSVVDGASVQVHDGGGAMIAVTTLAGSQLTLADGHATCTLTFTVHLPTDDHFTVDVGSVPPVRVEGQHLRHDGADLTIPLTG